MNVRRMCAVCREVKDKEQLIRIVRQGKNILLDKGGKTSGRGAYICKKEECIGKARKSRAFERSFSCSISPDLYDELEALI